MTERNIPKCEHGVIVGWAECKKCQVPVPGPAPSPDLRLALAKELVNIVCRANGMAEIDWRDEGPEVKPDDRWMKEADRILALLPQGGPAPVNFLQAHDLGCNVNQGKTSAANCNCSLSKPLGGITTTWTNGFSTASIHVEGEPSPEAGSHPLATLAQDQVDLPADFAKVLHENLWDLMTPGGPPKTEGRSAPGEPGPTQVHKLWEILDAYSMGHDLLMGESCGCKLCSAYGDLDWSERPDPIKEPEARSSAPAEASEAVPPPNPLPVPPSDPLREWYLWQFHPDTASVTPAEPRVTPVDDSIFIAPRSHRVERIRVREVLPGQEPVPMDATFWHRRSGEIALEAVARENQLLARAEAAEARLRESGRLLDESRCETKRLGAVFANLLQDHQNLKWRAEDVTKHYRVPGGTRHLLQAVEKLEAALKAAPEPGSSQGET